MALTESPVQSNDRQGMVQGQAQAKTPEPSDGQHFVHEHITHTDVVITDANSPLAVQIPEGVGASTAGHLSPLGEAFSRGTPEQQFAPKEEAEEVEPVTSEDVAAGGDTPPVPADSPPAETPPAS